MEQKLDPVGPLNQGFSVCAFSQLWIEIIQEKHGVFFNHVQTFFLAINV